MALVGAVEKPRVPFSYARVEARAAGSAPLCNGFEIYQADFFDRPLFDKYAQPTWIHESALTFKGQLEGAREAEDRVVIRNESNATIPCLRITVLDLLFVLDVKPGQRLDLPVSRQRGGAVYFEAARQGPDGKLAFVDTSFDRSAFPERGFESSVVISRDDRIVLSAGKVQGSR